MRHEGVIDHVGRPPFHPSSPTPHPSCFVRIFLTGLKFDSLARVKLYCAQMGVRPRPRADAARQARPAKIPKTSERRGDGAAPDDSADDQRRVNSKPSDREGDAGAAGAETLGRRLRRAREERNLTLRELSDQTRITRRHLEAIEADDYKQLPGGIFNRSFVKSYARAVGFDEAEALRLYTAAAGEVADETPTRQHSRIYTDDAPSRSPLVTAGISLIVLAVISLAAYAGLHYYRRTSDSDDSQPATAANAQATAVPAGQQPRPADTPAAAPAPSGLNVRVRAKGEDVWLRAKVDGEPTTDGILAADETREFSATESLSLQYAKVKAPALEVIINGRPAAVPAETAKGKSLVELLIRKDGYEQLLQQP